MTSIIIKPDMSLISRLEQGDPRIRYFPASDSKSYGSICASPQEFYEQVAGFEGAQMTQKMIFRTYIMDDLGKKISQEWEDEMPLRLRGTSVNIGPRNLYLKNGWVIPDVYQVLKAGTEREDRNHIPQTIFNNPIDGIHHRSRQWALQSTLDLREKASSEEQQVLFPAIIVYDNKAFAPDNSKMPTLAEDRAKLILGIYILDYVDCK